MRTAELVRLADYTTLGLGGPAARFVEAGTEDELVAAVQAADRAAEPVLVLGGGSNVVVADEGFPGTVVRVATTGLQAEVADGAARVTAAAGLDWDGLVAWCVADALSGIECLSGIPGLAGATPIQNVGAYGQEVAQTVVSVRVYDRVRAEVLALPAAECGFGYRTSTFKRDGDRYVVLSVTFRLGAGPMSAPIRYRELASALGVAEGERVPLADARAAVLKLRQAKGMVLDAADPDSRSVGSFFTNPVLTEAEFADLVARVGQPGDGPDLPPHWPDADGRVKVSAAWLIERAGFGKGYQADGVPGGARISTKHTLALTNPGQGTTADLIKLAKRIKAGVFAASGVQLANEPVLVGVAL